MYIENIKIIVLLALSWRIISNGDYILLVKLTSNVGALSAVRLARRGK